MAESTLTFKRSDLQAELGFFLGFGRTSGNWSADQTTEINNLLKAGERQFYYPPPLPGQRHSHKWSFLRPAAVIELQSSVGDYELPDDFGSLDGDLTYTDTDSQFTIVTLTSEPHVRSIRRNNTGTFSANAGFRPQWAAIRPRRTSLSNDSTRWEILFAPVPKASYQLEYRYHVLPDATTDAQPYPLGGAPHTETLIESCLAIAEQRMDDTIGLHSQKFLERLAASVQYDRNITQSGNLGYNHDLSDLDDFTARRVNIVTVGGVTPT